MDAARLTPLRLATCSLSLHSIPLTLPDHSLLQFDHRFVLQIFQRGPYQDLELTLLLHPPVASLVEKLERMLVELNRRGPDLPRLKTELCISLEFQRGSDRRGYQVLDVYLDDLLASQISGVFNVDLNLEFPRSRDGRDIEIRVLKRRIRESMTKGKGDGHLE